MSVSDWSTTAASNSNVGGVYIGEGMARSGVNNAIRGMMAELKTYFDTDITPITTPQSHGAVGDGVTDDTVAFQAAVDSGSAVFVPAGNYKITSAIVLPDACRIHGEGRDRSTITATACTAFSSPASVEHASIRDLEIIGDFTTASVYGVHAVNNSRGIKLSDLYIRGFGAAGNGAGVLLA